MVLSNHERTAKLGELGEKIAMKLLSEKKFEKIENFNKKNKNNPNFDLIAEKSSQIFLFQVKTRNKLTNIGSINGSYKLDISDFSNEIKKFKNPIIMWISIAIDTKSSSFDAYTSAIEHLYKGRIIMTDSIFHQYIMLAKNRPLNEFGLSFEEIQELSNEIEMPKSSKVELYRKFF
jgi:hypothetical protein